jgi:hypothetical protein
LRTYSWREKAMGLWKIQNETCKQLSVSFSKDRYKKLLEKLKHTGEDSINLDS